MSEFLFGLGRIGTTDDTDNMWLLLKAERKGNGNPEVHNSSLYVPQGMAEPWRGDAPATNLRLADFKRLADLK